MIPARPRPPESLRSRGGRSFPIGAAVLAALWAMAVIACGTPTGPEPATATHDQTLPMPQEAGASLGAALVAGPGPAQDLHTPPAERDTPVSGVTAASYLVADLDSGEVLLQSRAGERLPPASLTKIMTALVVLESTATDEEVRVDDAVLTLRASTLMGVQPGERLSVLDLLYGLMLPSGNDAAIALARHVAGDEHAFAGMMNQRARELGLHSTRFSNAHGLDFGNWAGTHYTTARDLAVLTRTAYAYPLFREIVAARGWYAQGAQRGYALRNSNELLWRYPGVDGAKIGYTRRAKQTLVATAARDGRRLLVVVLGSDGRTADGTRLLDAGFALPG